MICWSSSHSKPAWHYLVNAWLSLPISAQFKCLKICFSSETCFRAITSNYLLSYPLSYLSQSLLFRLSPFSSFFRSITHSIFFCLSEVRNIVHLPKKICECVVEKSRWQILAIQNNNKVGMQCWNRPSLVIGVKGKKRFFLLDFFWFAKNLNLV